MITEIMLAVLVMLCAIGFLVLSRAYAHNKLALPPVHADDVYNDEKMVALLAWRDEIEQMPSGYDKLKAKKRWLCELEAQMAENPQQTPPDLNNIIQLRQQR